MALKSSVCPVLPLVALISTCRPMRWTAATADNSSSSNSRSPRRSSASRRPAWGALQRTMATASLTPEPVSWRRPAQTSSRCRPFECDRHHDWAYSTKWQWDCEPTQATLSPSIPWHIDTIRATLLMDSVLLGQSEEWEMEQEGLEGVPWLVLLCISTPPPSAEWLCVLDDSATWGEGVYVLIR